MFMIEQAAAIEDKRYDHAVAIARALVQLPQDEPRRWGYAVLRYVPEPVLMIEFLRYWMPEEEALTDYLYRHLPSPYLLRARWVTERPLDLSAVDEAALTEALSAEMSHVLGEEAGSYLDAGYLYAPYIPLVNTVLGERSQFIEYVLRLAAGDKITSLDLPEEMAERLLKRKWLVRRHKRYAFGPLFPIPKLPDCLRCWSIRTYECEVCRSLYDYECDDDCDCDDCMEVYASGDNFPPYGPGEEEDDA
jgi:hypothetical protein